MMTEKLKYVFVLCLVLCGGYFLLPTEVASAMSDGARILGEQLKAVLPTLSKSRADSRGNMTVQEADKEERDEENADTDVSGKLKILCWIPTMDKVWDSRLRAINDTWTRRCDKRLYFITNPKHSNHSDVVSLSIPDSRATLTDKSVFAFQYLYTHYLHDFDWFLKADDDTYVIMENLKFLLSHFSATVPGYVGGRLKQYSPNGYMSGGAGYLFNSLGLKTLVEKGYHIPGLCCLKGGFEDLEVGRCAHQAGVQFLVNWDVKGKETFFINSITDFVVGPLHPLLNNMTLISHKAGLDCCSPLSISFHKMTPQLILTMEFLLYRVVVNGRRAGTFRKGEVFSGQISPVIDRSVKRLAYQGEKVEDYYKPGWRPKKYPVL